MKNEPVSSESSLTDVTAAILAGGLGTRLRAVIAHQPKVLAEVHGRPFVTYLLDQIAAAGIRRVVLCTGYRGEQVRAMLGDSCGSLRLVYSQEVSPLGTAGALRLALPLFESNAVLVMNGDSLCEVNFHELWAEHRARGAKATLVLVQMPDTARYGRVHVEANDRIVRFEEKREQGGPGWINAGMYLFSRPLLDTIPAKRAVSLEREVFPSWIGRGMYGFPSHGRFLDIGTPESYAAAEQFFAGAERGGSA